MDKKNLKAAGLRKKYIYGPLIFLATMVVAWWLLNFIVLKLFARNFQPTIMVTDTYLGWTIAPNVDADRTKWMHFDPHGKKKYYNNKYHVRTNSLGFRDDEISAGDKNKLRILCLGDSSTFGLGENEDAIFASLLETDLALGRPVRAYNLGVPGYTSLQGRLLFEKWMDKFNPDMVVITFGANDYKGVEERPIWSLRPTRPDSEIFGGKWKPGGWEKFKYNLLKTIMPFCRNSPVFFWYIEKRMAARYETPGRKTSGEARVSLEEYEENLGFIVDESAKRNARTVLVNICADEVYDGAATRFADRRGIPIVVDKRLYDTDIEGLKKSPGYSELLGRMESRFTPEILAQHPILRFTNDQCHPNLLGHKLIADYTAAAMETLLENYREPGDKMP